MAQQDGSPAKASGENIEQFGYKQNCEEVWDYGTWYCTASCSW